MADIPSISITNEFSDNDDDKTDNQIDLVATDCENLDSDSDSGRVTTSGSNLVAFTKNRRKSKKDDLTDYEDFDASGSEESEVPEVESQYEITMEEFLDQAFTEETTKYNGNKESSHNGPRDNERCHSPMLKNHLAVDADPGGVTDCEDIDASGDEDDAPGEYTELELPVYMDDNNTVESHDNVRSVLGHHHVTTTDSSVSSASSGDEHTPYKTKGKQSLMPHSDTENVLFSDYESVLKTCPKKPIISDLDEDEVLNVELSDADDELASEVDTSRCIGVHFKNHIKELHKPGTPQFSKLLDVLQDPNEGITDVENLNSSEDDEDECKPGCLTIPPAIVRTDNAYLTDLEDVDGVESEDEGVDLDSGITLPKPIRQLILVQETNTGDPVSRVMPLSDSLSPAADVGYLDKGLTDTEDLSDANEDMYDISQYLIESLPDMEAGRVTSSDKYTVAQLNLPGCSAEPVTDTEYMGEIKDTRKKRHKHRQSNRQKHRLAANVDDEEGHTDVEELLLTDQVHRRYSACNSQRAAAPMLTINNNDDGGHTDVEIMSGDEDTEVTPRSRRMQRNSSPNILNKSDWFNSAVATRESMRENGRKTKSNYLEMNLTRLRKLSPTPDAGHTDTEELTRSGDDDDEEEQIRGETPAAVHEELDGNSSTTYDRNVSVFDEQSERLNIKGHRDLQEALTDTELLEEESRK